MVDRIDSWASALGAEFDSVPENWVSVWRECSPEELERAARLGLSVPLPEMRPPEFRQEMELLDSFRPESVIQKGISRLNSIYASPSPADVPELPHRQERIVVEMAIDPKEAYVGDMNFIICLIPFIGASRVGMDRFHGAFRKYWESVMPLNDFLQQYERVERQDAHGWVIREATDDPIHEIFFSPEVMVLTPTISEKHIRLLK